MLEWLISASVLIIMVMVSRKLLRRKISCWVQYSLWLLVAVRLLVPVSPLESALSIANLLPENWIGQEAGEIPGGSGIEAAHGEEPGQGRISGQGVSDIPTADMTVPVLPHPAEAGHPLTEAAGPVEEGENSLLKNGIFDKIAGSKIWTVWLTGSCLLALWLLGVNGSFRWRVSRNRSPLAVSGKMQRQLPVYVTEEISTPCMYGLLRPVIYITPQAAEDSQMLAMVLCHEYMHYRHGDHIWSMVRMLCLCLHWYNPLVWAAVGLSRQDGELACDEGVLRQLGEEKRKCYGEALLALSTEGRPSLRRSLNLATSMSDTRRQLKERLSSLVTMPRMAAGTAVLVFLLVLGLVACTLTGRADAHGEDSASGKSAFSKMAPEDYGEIEEKVPDSEPPQESSFESREDMEDVPDYRYSWVLAEEYTGYLDEVNDWEQVYRNQDYDGDGLTDRIYQDVESEPGVMKMRVEFGNGEVLAFDTYQNSALMVHSLDLDGDGSRELLFTKPNDFSTNPPDIPSDILLFSRQGDGYRQVEVALEDAPEYGATPWEVYLVVSYSKEDDSHIRTSWRVPGAEGDLGKTQVFLCPVEDYEMEEFEYTSGGREYTAAYDAELIQERYAFLRLYFEGRNRSGDEIWVDMTLDDGRLSPVSSIYVDSRLEQNEMISLELEETGAVYDNWNVETLEYYDEEHRPVAEVTEGEKVTKLTYVETTWSLSAMEIQFSREILYWACQALGELEQWTGTSVTEACYCVSEFGDFYFAQTPADLQHSRDFYSRCYNNISGFWNGAIENIYYLTDMDVWYSPVKQYTTPPRYDKMTTEEILTWYFERSALAAGSRMEEITCTEQGDYIIRTDQGKYYEYFLTDGIHTMGKGLSLYGPYDDYPQH